MRSFKRTSKWTFLLSALLLLNLVSVGAADVFGSCDSDIEKSFLNVKVFGSEPIPSNDMNGEGKDLFLSSYRYCLLEKSATDPSIAVTWSLLLQNEGLSALPRGPPHKIS